MVDRPEIDDCPDAATFREWYYLKEELAAYARSKGISTAGAKFDIADRIAHFLDTGERQKPKRAPRAVSRFDWHSAPLDDATIITDSYRNTQNVRQYFAARISGFSFSIAFMDWMKANAGKTLGDAVEVAKEIKAAKAAGHKAPDQPHNQYNAYTRAYFAAVPDGSQSELRALWKARRRRPGPYVFDVNDLDLIRSRS